MTKPLLSHDALLALAPAALLLLFALRTGTLDGAAMGAWVTIGHATLIAFAALGARHWRNPLFSGRASGLPVAGLLGWVALSCFLSPVPRAGWTGVLILPAFVLVPAAVARCWSNARRRTHGITAVVGVLALVATWSLIAWGRGVGPRPALPLGHHNLLAAFVVMLLPMTIVLAQRRGLPRVFGLGAGVLGIVTIVASRSLAGTIALIVVLLVALLPRRHGALAALALVAVTLTQTPRLSHILHGDDRSVQARSAYARAALEGIVSRPLLGWGPGATPWTIADQLPPRPGILPAGHVIGHVHNLLLQVTYELGLPGLGMLLLLLVSLVWRHGRGRAQPDDEPTRRAAWSGLLAGGMISLGGLPLTTTALPLTLALLVGLVLASSPHPSVASTPNAGHGTRAPAWVVLLLCALGLARLDAAHRAYDRAVGTTDTAERRASLDRALHLDPRHPLYRARRAWLVNDTDEARQAAEAAQGIAALWLAAGSMALDAGAPWAPDALERACQLDPLGPMAPFLYGIDFADDEEAPARLARALAADPRLLAARALRASPLRDAVATRVGTIEGIDAYWRDATQQRLLASPNGDRPINAPPQATARPTATLALGFDDDPSTSLSLFAFRRQPWATTLVAITLTGDTAGATALGAAANRRDTDPRVFSGHACTVGQRLISSSGP